MTGLLTPNGEARGEKRYDARRTDLCAISPCALQRGSYRERGQSPSPARRIHSRL